jgi:DNA polymerase-4
VGATLPRADPYNGGQMEHRQIVHIDMDAFYASVEQRDDPRLRGKPVVVAWKGARSVVCAASYEARKFGVRSAMPSVTAERLCPSAIFIAPDFSKNREASRAIHDIFHRHTDLIEPLSLDEAYLDVTVPKSNLKSGREVAQSLRQDIRQEVNLVASAGIAGNKFLSKIASDWGKPDGLFEIKPEDVEAFLAPLSLGRLPGIGKVTEERLLKFGLRTVSDVRPFTLAVLETSLGSLGRRIYDFARGIDNSPVVVDRPTQSISAEDTFEADVPLQETTEILICLAERVWQAASNEPRTARTVVLKLRTSDFQIVTRSHTPATPPACSEDVTAVALWLQNRVGLNPKTKFRLVGVGLTNFADQNPTSSQPSLF